MWSLLQKEVVASFLRCLMVVSWPRAACRPVIFFGRLPVVTLFWWTPHAGAWSLEATSDREKCVHRFRTQQPPLPPRHTCGSGLAPLGPARGTGANLQSSWLQRLLGSGPCPVASEPRLPDLEDRDCKTSPPDVQGSEL